MTEQQKAYHLRKMRTAVARLDVNKTGVITRENFKTASSRLLKYSNLTEEQAQNVHDGSMKVADLLDLKQDKQFENSAFAIKASDIHLSMTEEEAVGMIECGHGAVYDAINTNNDGHISVKEFSIYLNVVAPDITEKEVRDAFDVIDEDKNGEISREEFLEAAKDFFFGVEETKVSRVFWGKLLD